MQTATTDGAAEAASEDQTDAQAGISAEADTQASGEAAAQAPASPTSLADILANGSEDDVRNAMRQLESGAAEFTDTAGDNADDGTEDTETEGTQGEESTTAAQADDGDEAPKGQPRRIQIHRFPAKDQALLIAAQDLVRENKGLSLADALAEVGFECRVKGTESPHATQAAAEAAVEEPAPEAQSPLAEATAKVAELKKARAEAKSRFDFDEENRIEDALDEAKAALFELTQAAKASAKAEVTERQAREDAEFARLGKELPELTTPGTPLNAEANKVLGEKEKSDPSFFKNPNWPSELTALALGRVMLTGKTGKKPAAAVSKEAVKPRVVPSKQGTRVAMLATGNGADDGGNLLARASRSDASADDIRAAMRALT